jgi:hypothetical protein
MNADRKDIARVAEQAVRTMTARARSMAPPPSAEADVSAPPEPASA